MVRILQERIYDGNKRYVELFCLSKDTKPTSGLVTGSRAVEVDTGDVYLFDETETGTWYTQSAAGSNDGE